MSGVDNGSRVDDDIRLPIFLDRLMKTSLIVGLGGVSFIAGLSGNVTASDLSSSDVESNVLFDVRHTEDARSSRGYSSRSFVVDGDLSEGLFVSGDASLSVDFTAELVGVEGTVELVEYVNGFSSKTGLSTSEYEGFVERSERFNSRLAELDGMPVSSDVLPIIKAEFVSLSVNVSGLVDETVSSFKNVFEKKGAQPGVKANGQLEKSDMCELSYQKGIFLDCGAAADLELLNEAYRAEFGEDLLLSGGYRSYSQQVSTKAAKGDLAATPGKSNHGWGRAVDINQGRRGLGFGGVRYDWLMSNGFKYFWVNPSWAQVNGSNPEAWHWEWVGK